MPTTLNLHRDHRLGNLWLRLETYPTDSCRFADVLSLKIVGRGSLGRVGSLALDVLAVLLSLS